jgi:HEAT repeat protein
MNIENSIKMLLGEINTNLVNDPVPDYLAQKYDRQGAAINLGESSSDDPKVIEALRKASTSDEEEDVRLASLEALIKLEQKAGVQVARILINDEDELVRDAAASFINELDT